MTSSWFFLSTLNYDARSTTHQFLPMCLEFFISKFLNRRVILFVKWEIFSSLITKQSFRFLRNYWYFLISRVMLHIICNIHYITVYSCFTIHLECMNNENIRDNIKNNINHLQVEFLYERITLRLILIW